LKNEKPPNVMTFGGFSFFNHSSFDEEV
jgi:hypothetical protein